MMSSAAKKRANLAAYEEELNSRERRANFGMKEEQLSRDIRSSFEVKEVRTKPRMNDEVSRERKACQPRKIIERRLIFRD